LHNPHSFTVKGATSATGFNIGLAKKGDKLEKPVTFRGGAEKQGSFYRVQCDQHEFMQSFFLPVWNPYHAVVKDDGTFELKVVPPEKHSVSSWPRCAGREKAVKMKGKGTEGEPATVRAKIKKEFFFWGGLPRQSKGSGAIRCPLFFQRQFDCRSRLAFHFPI